MRTEKYASQQNAHNFNKTKLLVRVLKSVCVAGMQDVDLKA